MGDVKAKPLEAEEVSPKSLLDAHCAFCETPLGADVHAAHTCVCVSCGGEVLGWRLREDEPPTCELCQLGGLGDDDSFDHALRG